uniref:Uncharacterized protein n=1 Tax=Arundo donax TaxID=35708 RepID=A0A0A9G161_ARUDO
MASEQKIQIALKYIFLIVDASSTPSASAVIPAKIKQKLFQNHHSAQVHPERQKNKRMDLRGNLKGLYTREALLHLLQTLCRK